MRNYFPMFLITHTEMLMLNLTSMAIPTSPTGTRIVGMATHHQTGIGTGVGDGGMLFGVIILSVGVGDTIIMACPGVGTVDGDGDPHTHGVGITPIMDHPGDGEHILPLVL